jgi:hypothetical protein
MHFVTFLPNALRIGRGELLNHVMGMAARAKWVAETLYGDNWNANLNLEGRPLATPALGQLLEGLQQDESDA